MDYINSKLTDMLLKMLCWMLPPSPAGSLERCACWFSPLCWSAAWPPRFSLYPAATWLTPEETYGIPSTVYSLSCLVAEQWPSSLPTRCKQQPLHAGQPWWAGPVSSLWPGRWFQPGGTDQRRRTAEPSRRPRTSWTSRSTQWLQTRQRRCVRVGVCGCFGWGHFVYRGQHDYSHKTGQSTCPYQFMTEQVLLLTNMGQSRILRNSKLDMFAVT